MHSKTAMIYLEISVYVSERRRWEMDWGERAKEKEDHIGLWNLTWEQEAIAQGAWYGIVYITSIIVKRKN